MKTREIKLAVDPTQKNIKMQNFTFPSYKQPEKPRGISDTHQLISVADNRALYLFGREKRGSRCCGMFSTYKFTNMYAVVHLDPSSGEISQIKEKKMPVDISTLCLAPNKKYYITATDKELFKVTLEGDELKFASFMPLTLPAVDSYGLKRRYNEFIFLSDAMLLIAHDDVSHTAGPKHINLIDLEAKKCVRTFEVSSLNFKKINQTQFAVLQNGKIDIFDITKTEKQTINPELDCVQFIPLDGNRLVVFGLQPKSYPYKWCMRTRCLTSGEEKSFPVSIDLWTVVDHRLFASSDANQWFISYYDGHNRNMRLDLFEWGQTKPLAQWFLETDYHHRGHHHHELFWNPLERGQLVSPGGGYDFSSLDFYSMGLESSKELEKECKQISSPVMPAKSTLA